MAVGFGTLVGSANATTAAATLVVTVPAAGVALGRVMVVATGVNQDLNVAAPTCADSKGNVYTLGIDAGPTTGNQRRTTMFYSPLTVALVSGDTITVTFNNTTQVPDRRTMMVAEFTGVRLVTPLDLTGVDTDSSAVPTTGPTGIPDRDDEVVVGAICWSSIAAGENVIPIPANGYTEIAETSAFSGTGRNLQMQYKLGTGGVAQDSSWRIRDAANANLAANSATAIISLKGKIVDSGPISLAMSTGQVTGSISGADRIRTIGKFSSAAAGNTSTITLSTPVSVGNTIVVSATLSGDPVTRAATVADSSGNLYTKIFDVAPGSVRSAMFVGYVSVALIVGNTIVLTTAGNAITSRSVMAEEYSGLLSGSLDQLITSSDPIGSATPTTGAITTTQEQEILLTVLSARGGVSYAYTPTSPFTAGDNVRLSNKNVFSSYLEVTVIGTYSTGALIGTSQEWVMSLVGLKTLSPGVVFDNLATDFTLDLNIQTAASAIKVSGPIAQAIGVGMSVTPLAIDREGAAFGIGVGMAVAGTTIVRDTIGFTLSTALTSAPSQVKTASITFDIGVAQQTVGQQVTPVSSYSVPPGTLSFAGVQPVGAIALVKYLLTPGIMNFQGVAPIQSFNVNYPVLPGNLQFFGRAPNQSADVSYLVTPGRLVFTGKNLTFDVWTIGT